MTNPVAPIDYCAECRHPWHGLACTRDQGTCACPTAWKEPAA